MSETIALVLGGFAVVVTGLSLIRSKAWWIRIWDFPRVQVATVGIGALALWVAAGRWRDGWNVAFTVGVGIALAYQIGMVWRYTRLAPREVERARRAIPECSLSVVVSNVLQTNRAADRVLAALRDASADVLLCVETDEWWRERLDALRETHPHTLACPLPNTYGMLVYSRYPLEETAIDFLIERDVPSMQAKVRLPSDVRVWLNCVHPRPPAPSEDDESTERDAELVTVGRRVADSPLPVIVCGDLNDVAWSRTTRLFQKMSRLVDPRKGRGFISTFHARYPGFRYPLDHVFHSPDLRLIEMRRLPYVGSDHFPVYVALSYEPEAATRQEAPRPTAADAREADETANRAGTERR
ncbi:MAG TPA: endonuclease/exonuclease/phosphatase family protein [Gemmatimonadaceae bacterium]|nr:endonuclease/exonuclease/phosphatase family protein [Gemmatimonadaceae bacterium]